MNARQRYVALAGMAGAGLCCGIVRAHRAAGIRRATVLYDGGCPLCRASVLRLRRWDRRRRLDYLDARDTSALTARFPNVPRDPGLREVRLVLADGLVLGGYDAARVLATMLPPFRLVAPLLFLPGVRPLGIAVYHFVARLRPRDQPCSEEIRALPEAARDT